MPRLNLNFFIVLLGVVTFIAVLNFLLDLFLQEKARWFEELTAERNLEVELSKRDELKAALKSKTDAEKIFYFKRWKSFGDEFK